MCETCKHYRAAILERDEVIRSLLDAITGRTRAAEGDARTREAAAPLAWRPVARVNGLEVMKAALRAGAGVRS